MLENDKNKFGFIIYTKSKSENLFTLGRECFNYKIMTKLCYLYLCDTNNITIQGRKFQDILLFYTKYKITE